MSEKQAKHNRQDEAKKPKVVNTLVFNLLVNGRVTVSGPITDPIVVIDILSAGLGTLVQFWTKQKEVTNRIVQASDLPSNLILPGRG